MTIADLLARHFRKSDATKTSRDTRGLEIGVEEAARCCARLTPRQRAAVDADTVAALDVLMTEVTRGIADGQFPSDLSRCESGAWFRSRRHPEPERSRVTLAAVRCVARAASETMPLSLGTNRHNQRCLELALGAFPHARLNLDAEQARIVPDRSPAKSGDGDALFLPFEGDTTLSVILSKAFLLADDTKIADTTITRQIRR